MQALIDLIPRHAADVRLNLKALDKHEHLDRGRTLGTALACALALRDPALVTALAPEAREALGEQGLAAARSAAETMAMNNVYYRFNHLVSNEAYGRMPARLRMQAMATHGVDELDFELWSLAVSALNGCGACLDAHERKLTRAGASPEMIQDAVRIAAVIHAAAVALEGERALSSPGAEPRPVTSSPSGNQP
jgi:alkyl hydroperoxide reductase subunit D